MTKLIDDGSRDLYVFNKQESGWRRNIAPLAVTYISRLDFTKIPQGVKMIIVFGSAVRPSFRQESDIDFCFLVTDVDRRQVIRECGRWLDTIGKQYDMLFYTSEEFISDVSLEHDVCAEINKEGVIIFAKDDNIT